MREPPVYQAAAGFFAGLLLAFWGSSPIAVLAGLILGLGLRRPLAAAALLLGFFYGGLKLHRLPRPPHPGRLTLEGRVLRTRPSAGGEGLLVETPYGRGLILVPEEYPECLPGTRFRAGVQIYPEGPRNPFAPSPEALRLARGISFRGRVRLPEGLLCYGEPRGPISAARERLLFFARGLSPPAGGLFAAVILGEKGFLPRDLEERIRRRGLYHFLAVSGFHLGIVFAALYALFRALIPRLLSRPALPAQIPALWGGLAGATLYAAFSGFPASALRALTMLALYTLGRTLFRGTSGGELLAGAVLILLVLFPQGVLDLSFRLSVLAVAGILLAHRFAEPFLRPRSRLWRYPLEVLVLSLGAWLLTLPLVLYTFGEASLPGPLYTALYLPLWSLLLIPGEMIVALLVPILPGPAARIAEFLGGVLVWSLKIPLPSPLIVPFFPVGLFVLTILSSEVALVLALKRRGRAAALATLTALLFLVLGLRVRRSLFYAVVFDLGKKSSTLVHLPGNRNLLFDAGSPVLSTALRKLGIDRLDLVILSHPDRDHIAGLPGLTRNLRTEGILSGLFRPSSWGDPVLFREVDEVTVPLFLRLDKAEVFLLPGRPFPENENRESLVAYLEYRGLTLFFPGDIDRVRLRRLSGEGGLLPAEIFVLPHHGARNGLWPPAWTKIHPAVALAQARGIRHPHPEVRKWLAARGVPLYVTGERGALFVLLKDGGFLICSEEGLRGGLPKALLWPYIPYVTGRGCDEYTLHSLRNL